MTSTTDNILFFNTRPILRNTLFNICGYGIPLCAAVFTIPFIIKGLGADRFGVLTLSWTLIGYLGLFDLGMGRALTQIVAEKLGKKQSDDIPSLIWTAICVMGIFGLIVAVIAAITLPWLARDILKIPMGMGQEVELAFLLIAGFVPVVIVSVGLRGVLDAYHRFDLTNSVRIPLGLFTFISPLLIMPFTINIVTILIVLMIGRLVGIVVQINFCIRLLPENRKKCRFDSTIFRALLKFGAWMSVTNIIAPLMMYLDRFFIGAMISMAAVTYFATPSEVITKLLLISGALMGVLFPAFSRTYEKDPNQTAGLFYKGLQYVYVIMFPLIILILLFAEEGLSVWLNQEFVRQSSLIVKYLAIGVFFISLGQVPYALIQGTGRPDLTAKLHLFEFPLYLCVLWALIRAYGINGAAIAWVVRSFIDAMAMYYLARRRLISIKTDLTISTTVIIVIFFSLAVVAGFIAFPFTIKLVLLFVFTITHLIICWQFLIDEHDRGLIKHTLPFTETSRS